VVGKPHSPGEEIAQKWTECLPVVAAYVRSMTLSFHDAQDILQEISIIVVRKYGEYNQTRPFIPWVIGIARNEVLAYRRRLGADRRLFDEAVVDQITQAFGENKDQWDALAEALEDCVKRVPERSRRLLRLRYIDDLRYEQMAQALGASVTSIKVAMHRLRQGLRTCIERHPAARGTP
jgi:RNA polymerase sigma-70 factor, ECF subfamily